MSFEHRYVIVFDIVCRHLTPVRETWESVYYSLVAGLCFDVKYGDGLLWKYRTDLWSWSIKLLEGEGEDVSATGYWDQWFTVSNYWEVVKHKHSFSRAGFLKACSYIVAAKVLHVLCLLFVLTSTTSFPPPSYLCHYLSCTATNLQVMQVQISRAQQAEDLLTNKTKPLYPKVFIYVFWGRLLKRSWKMCLIRFQCRNTRSRSRVYLFLQQSWMHVCSNPASHVKNPNIADLQCVSQRSVMLASHIWSNIWTNMTSVW